MKNTFKAILLLVLVTAVHSVSVSAAEGLGEKSGRTPDACATINQQATSPGTVAVASGSESKKEEGKTPPSAVEKAE